MFVEIELRDILEHPLGNGSVLVLQEREGNRVCLISVGPVEASTLADQVEGVVAPRPMTHDLIVDLLSCSDAAMTGTYIERESASTYYASIQIEKEGGEVKRIDARPSDAITLALKQSSPIYIRESLLNCETRSPGFTRESGQLAHKLPRSPKDIQY